MTTALDEMVLALTKLQPPVIQLPLVGMNMLVPKPMEYVYASDFDALKEKFLMGYMHKHGMAYTGSEFPIECVIPFTFKKPGLYRIPKHYL